MTVVDPKVKEWATPRQCEVIDAVNTAGSIRAAAATIGVSRASVQEVVRTAKARAARAGWSPDHDMTHPVPEPLIVKGISTYYNKDGERAGQWVKSTLDQQKLELAIRAAVTALADEVVRAQATPAPTTTQNQLCVEYIFTDCHVGMLAWGAETGADWDLQIAEETLCRAFDHLIAAAPQASTAVVCNLGDFMHYDSMAAVTPTSGHILDADGRYSKMIKVAIRILRYIVTGALLRHENVVVVMGEGNHDMFSSAWLRHLFSLLYENEPRVKVVDSELPYYIYEHGNTLLAYHHGHLKKNAQLPLMFAAQFPEAWGRTKYRYCSTGHRHHVEEKEHSGMTVVQHPTIAARDAYAARGGWIADRKIAATTFHTEYGLVAKNVVVPEMLQKHASTSSLPVR